MKKDSQPYTASSYPSKLVWLLSFLALYTTFIMVTIVWWTLVDVRSEREKLETHRHEINTIKTEIDSLLEKEKWSIATILDGAPLTDLADPMEFPKLIEEFQKKTHASSFLPIFDSVHNQVNELLQLRTLSQLWFHQQQKNLKKLPEMQKRVESILRHLDEAVSSAAGRIKLNQALSIREYRKAENVQASRIAADIIKGLTTSADLSSIIRDIQELTLLYEQLLNEMEPDHLAHLKNNRILTVLNRLQRGALLTSYLKDHGFILNEVAEVFFGKGYQIDQDHQAIALGSDENLYQLCLSRSEQFQKKNSLQSDLRSITASLHANIKKITAGVEQEIQKEAEGAESAIKRALQIILIVGGATATIFLAISYKIILEIRGQIKAIEDTNVVLDKRTKALSESEEALLQSEKQLQFLSSNLLTAQEKERQRISHELHDELGQAMAALKMQVGAIERHLDAPQEHLRNECFEIRSFIDQIIENMRRLSKDLSPVVIDDLGLEAAIDYLATNFASLHNIHFTLDLDDINPLFSQESQRLIYRIIQEALTNISKHADARQIFIATQINAEGVTFVIQDDGNGFNVKEVLNQRSIEKGMGLATMAERVRILGGSLEFKSDPGGGTTVVFTAPRHL